MGGCGFSCLGKEQTSHDYDSGPTSREFADSGAPASAERRQAMQWMIILTFILFIILSQFLLFWFMQC
jgi:hypothetical protein